MGSEEAQVPGTLVARNVSQPETSLTRWQTGTGGCEVFSLDIVKGQLSIIRWEMARGHWLDMQEELGALALA